MSYSQSTESTMELFFQGTIALSVMTDFIVRYRYQLLTSFVIANDHGWPTLILYYLIECLLKKFRKLKRVILIGN